MAPITFVEMHCTCYIFNSEWIYFIPVKESNGDIIH